MDRRLIIVGIIGVFLIVTLIITLTIVDAKSSDGSTKTTCFTPGCDRAASLVLQYLNRSIEPCDDFYEFACGGFEKSTVIPDAKSAVDIFSTVYDKVREQLRTSIEEPSSPGEPRPFRIAKDLYKTCMNESAIEQTGLEPLRFILTKLGGWPVLVGDDWRTRREHDEFDFDDTIRKFRYLGYFHTLATSANDVEPKNSIKGNEQLILEVPILPRGYLIEGLKNQVVKAYFDFMVYIAVTLGAEKQFAVKDLEDSLEFETKLANVLWSTEERRRLNLLNTTMTEQKIVELYQHDRAEVYSNTPQRARANYFLWRIVQALIQYLPEDVRAIQFNFLRMLDGREAREARWKECVDIVAGSMPVSVGALYVRNHFNIDTKKKAEEMMNDLRMAFVEILEQAEWMDDETRTRALEKVDFMRADIAYPEELRNDTKLEEYYANLNKVTADNLLVTAVTLRVFDDSNTEEYLNNTSTIKTNWISYSRAAIANAYYFFQRNIIQVPAAILQGGLFSTDRPRYMNYGAIGFVLGHEITHGFDNEGSKHDKRGQIKNWWDAETERKYSKKTECIFHQYENYTVESVGSKLNGFHTLGENIADNGGLKEAYLAYKNWVKTNGPEQTLPGLDYTPAQMFWISAAHVWCTRYTPEMLKLQIMQNVHSPARFRVIGPFSNNPDFSTDFNCPSGSAMNPVDKCSVW